jgi:molybdopterin molybdotransferase
MTLGAAQVAAAATVGAGMLEVFDRPRVAILSTGDELVDIGHQPGPFQVRNANNILLYAILRRLGCQIVDLGIAHDRPGELRGAIEDGMMHDVVLVTGGMSLGRHDHVRTVFGQVGAEVKIERLRIKPGKPFVFAVAPRRLIPGRVDARSYAEVTHALPPRDSGRTCFLFGLPGNPVSAYVCTLRLVARVLRRLAGGPGDSRWVTATLQDPLEANGPREFYQPAVLDDQSRVRPLKWKGSADLFTLAAANALIMRPENQPALPAGSAVMAMVD